jgi:hypothetical protein
MYLKITLNGMRTILGQTAIHLSLITVQIAVAIYFQQTDLFDYYMIFAHFTAFCAINLQGNERISIQMRELLLMTSIIAFVMMIAYNSYEVQKI